MTKKEQREHIASLEAEMKKAAEALQFEQAALLRDQVLMYKARQ